MYAVSNKYKQIIYSGDAKHRLSLLFNNVEYENANTKVEYVKVKSNILSNGEERFNLDNFVSKEVEIKIHEIDLQDIVEPVEISIGTLVDEEYEYVPIGIFNLSEAPTKDDKVTTIKLRDNSVKFDIPYNAETIINNQYVITTDETYLPAKNYYSYSNEVYILLIEGTDYDIGNEITGNIYEEKGSVTMKKLLQDICDTCGVTLATTSFINQYTEISVWDNSITARQYVMYIAEKAASIATINRNGELLLVPINNELTTFELDSYLIESFTEHDKFVISRVVYEDAIRKFEYGEILDEGENTTLYISASNPYITDTTQIENIYNSIDGFSIYGMKISKILGNPALDPYDLISFTYKGKTYVTFAQNELTYNGVIIQNFDTNIGTLEKAQENVTLNTEESRFKRVYTQINQLEGTIELNSSEISNVKVTAGNAEAGVSNLDSRLSNYYTREQTEKLVLDSAQGVTNTFQTSGGTNVFRNTGLWFRTNDSNNPYEFWEGNVVKSGNDKAVNLTSLLLQSGTLLQEQIIPNGSCVVSFKYKKLIQLSNPKIKINDVEYLLTNIEDTEFEKQIEINSQHINIQFITDIDNSCEIYDLMVNVGTTKFAYSQNQNETTTDTVNISKGITITSSNTETEFKANADGIRTLDKSGNELTKFTDKGMTTKEMIAQDTSQIVGTLWQEVGGQTWITRL